MKSVCSMRLVFLVLFSFSLLSFSIFAKTPESKQIAQYSSSTITLSEIVSNGRFIILSDGSVWEIQMTDQNITREWISASVITIEPSQDQTYPYSLKNEDTQSTVMAKKSSLGEIYLLIEEEKTDQVPPGDEKINEQPLPSGKSVNVPQPIPNSKP